MRQRYKRNTERFLFLAANDSGKSKQKKLDNTFSLKCAWPLSVRCDAIRTKQGREPKKRRRRIIPFYLFNARIKIKEEEKISFVEVNDHHL